MENLLSGADFDQDDGVKCVPESALANDNTGAVTMKRPAYMVGLWANILGVLGSYLSAV